MREALERLLTALPRCCACTNRIGVIYDIYRWPLCAECWVSMPGSDTDKPVVDIREEVALALEELSRPPPAEPRKKEHDSLTGLPRRTLLQAHMDKVLGMRVPFCLLFIDLDNFKQVNDVYGHKTGDALLRQIASQLQQCIRAGDLAVRVGGDEFVVLLANTDHGDDAAGRVRQALLPVVTSYGAGASVGFATYPLDGSTLEDLLSTADDRMYQAKNSKRG
jgi:diguanylate cyclase (GGDEF)-like protein